MYIVIELQTLSDGTVANIVTPYTDRNQAESKYHQILAAAALSSMPCHAAVLLTHTGKLLASQYYEHVSGMTGGNTEDE